MTILSTNVRNGVLGLLSKYMSDKEIRQILTLVSPVISTAEVQKLELRFSTLIDVPINLLRLPKTILSAFEPSQIGTIVGTLVDACIPELDKLLPEKTIIEEIGLLKHEGVLGEREGYPDYKTTDDYRLELKLLYVDPVDVVMKKPPTPREPSARLTQQVTVKNVDPEKDLLLVIAYQLQELPGQRDFYVPTITDIGVFPVIHCILARDIRLYKSGGQWFGDFETPTVLSKKGRIRKHQGLSLDNSTYGRKESEGKDFNEDTNFGKLKRIPYQPLQDFLRRNQASAGTGGFYLNE